MKNYSITIEIFRKGTYKIYSFQLMNKKFEAIKHSVVNQSSDTFYTKTLSSEEAKDIENIISALPIENLQDEYINREVRGERHLIYHITKDEKQKKISVYYKDQPNLKRLYEKLMYLVPEKYRVWYYR